MDPSNTTIGAEAAEDPARRRAAERLIGALQKAVRIVGYFSAQHQAATAALDEIVEVATQVTTEFAELTLKLTGEGLYVGEHRISHYSPTEDPHLFRLFHNGVRQLSFRAGITREDILGFLEAITADMSQPEFAEEDVITTLWARNIVGIRWVVVETFTEVQGDEDPEVQTRASDELSSFLDDALRDNLGGDLHLGSAGEDSALTLTGGDVRFFQAEAIGALLGALPKEESTGTPDEVYAIGGDEAGSMIAEIGHGEAALPRRFLDAILAATTQSATADDMMSAAQCVALTLGTVARQSGHAAIGDVFGRLLQWLATIPADDKLAIAVTEMVLGSQLVTNAVASIDSCADEDVPVVLSILGAAPPDAVLRVVRDVTTAKTRDRRRDVFSVLLRRHGGPELFGTLLRELDEDGATDVLDACTGLASAVDAQPVAAASAIHHSAPVRARGVQMLARAGVEATLPLIAEKLFDPDSGVRMAAIRAMASTGKSAEFLRSTLQSPEIAVLLLPEKRLLALLLAHVEGMRAAPLLHMLLGRKAIFGAVQNDEVRTAAAAGLGYIPDPRAQASLERIARSSFSTAALKTEARKVADALAAGRAAYHEAELRHLLAPPPPSRPIAQGRRPVSTAPLSGAPLPPAPIRPTAPPGGRRPTLSPTTMADSSTPVPPSGRASQPPPFASMLPPATPPVAPAVLSPTPAAFGVIPAPPSVASSASPPIFAPTPAPPFAPPPAAPVPPVPAARAAPVPVQAPPVTIHAPAPQRAVPPITVPVQPPPVPTAATPLVPTRDGSQVTLPRATAPTPLPPTLPSSAMVTPKMGKGAAAKRRTSEGDAPGGKRTDIDTLLAEFNAVDEPFALADLAPRSTTSASDLLELDDPLPAMDNGERPSTAPVMAAVHPEETPPEPPPPAIPPERAEALSDYMFEDEHGLGFRLGGRRAPPPEALHDLLRSYLVDEAS